MVAALVGTALLRDNLSGSVRQDSESTSTQLLRNGHGPYLGRRRRRLESTEAKKKRLAVVRPFAPFSAAEITQSFDTWDTYWPCTSNPLHPFDTESEPGESTSGYDYEYVVDLYLSFSQAYANIPPSDMSHSVKDELLQKFKMNGGWNGCFDKLYNIGKWFICAPIVVAIFAAILYYCYERSMSS